MNPRRPLFPLLAALALLGGLLVSPVQRQQAAAAPPRSPAQDNIVISEFRTRGEGGVYDEFIELFNPTGAVIDISGWSILRSSACGASSQVLAVIPGPLPLAPGQHYLVASSAASAVSPDLVYTSSPASSISDTGGLALANAASTVVDQAGMCATTLYFEGASLAPLTLDLNRGYERLPGGSSGNCTDTDNNTADFQLVSPNNPQNTSSPFTLGCTPPTRTPTATGTFTLTFTPTLTFTFTTTSQVSTSTPTTTHTSSSTGGSSNPTHTQTRTSTPTSTHTLSAPQGILISEFRTRGPQGGEDEFIELYNPGSSAVDLGGWMLKRSASCGSSLFNLAAIPAGITLQPGRHYLLLSSSNSSLSGADQTFPAGIADDGGLALLDSSGAVVDQVGMCVSTAYREGTHLAPLSGTSDQGYEREPGGPYGSCQDTGDNEADFTRISPSQPQNLAAAAVTCSTPPTATPTHTPTRTTTVLATTTSTGSAITISRLFISEFRTRGPNGADDEFVELYNPTGGPVNIGGWTIRRSGSCSTTVSVLVTINTGMILQPGQHYLLLSNLNSSLSSADQLFSPALADDGGLALVDASSNIIDQAGMCASTAFREGTILAPLAGTASQSYERLPGGSTACQDSNNNLSDFQLISPSNPQGRSSAIAYCAGVLTHTPTRTGTQTRTPTRNYTATRTPYPGFLVLNEFLPHPSSDWNQDGNVDIYDEYIEVLNMGVDPINIKGWVLDDIADSGSSPYTLPDLTLAQYEIARFFASETGIYLSDGGDTVRLLTPIGTTADLRNYTVITAWDRTWCRLPDGNGAWAFTCRPTPGRPNTPAGGEPPAPDEEIPWVTSTCPLPDTAPEAFRLAECGSGGGTLSLSPAEAERSLEQRWKWGVFVK